jgi:hypothetical protein
LLFIITGGILLKYIYFKNRLPVIIKSNLKLSVVIIVSALTFFMCEVVIRLYFNVALNASVSYYSFYPHDYFKGYGLQIAKEAAMNNFADSLNELYDVNPTLRQYGIRTKNVVEMEKSFEGVLVDNPMKMWNVRYLKSLSNVERFRFSLGNYKNGYVYSYLPYDTGFYPTYCYLPNSYRGKGSPRFNKFGWGGSDIELVKKPNKIRIAFLGASTTQQFGCCNFAYPDYIEAWFDAWAKQRHLDIDFEVINSARVAQRSMDMRAIFEYELKPINPDIVVYYEGRNQMFRWNMEGIVVDKEGAALSFKIYDFIMRHSLLVQFVLDKMHVKHRQMLETVKRPAAEISLNRKWNDRHLPIGLNEIFSDVQAIDKASKEINCKLVFTSYAMIIDTDFLYKPNWGSHYGYYLQDFGDVRVNSIAANSLLQRKLYADFAFENNISFIDVATPLLKKPELFGDPIHLSCDGMKYQAWIVFNGLLPMVERKILSKELPQLEFRHYDKHPYIRDTVIRFPIPRLFVARNRTTL